MKDSCDIETQLEKIMEIGHTILETLEQDEPELATVKTLLDKRGEQLKVLDDIKLDRSKLSEGQIEELRNLFTRINLLEKRINNIFAKLSLNSKKSLKEIEIHKKAKKSYTASKVKSKFLDAQING